MADASIIQEIEAAKQFAKQGDYQHALGCLNGVLLHDPHHPEALFVMGGIYLKQGFPARAAEAWTRVLEYDPNHEKARAWLDRLSES